MINSEILSRVKSLRKSLETLTDSPKSFQSQTFQALDDIILEAEEDRESHRAFLRRKLAEIDAEI